MRLEQVIAELLIKKGMTISVCESCTGGMLGNIITSIPGSSKYFSGGIIAYSNRVKEKIVGVRHATLKKHGAVSAQVAREMAQGVRKKLKTDLGIAITGIAGPSGGTKKKPIGAVFICLVTRKKICTEYHEFTGRRDHIRKAACKKALGSLKLLLAEK